MVISDPSLLVASVVNEASSNDMHNLAKGSRAHGDPLASFKCSLAEQLALSNNSHLKSGLL